MKTIHELAASLRAIHAAKVRHFATSGGVQAFAIVATEERLADLLAAADALDRNLTPEKVRDAARDTLGLEYGGITASDNAGHRAIRSLCKRLGVEL